jgi:phosphoglucosamine mutase
MSTLFGTDGVRGTPGVPPLDAETLSRLGAAIAWALSPSIPETTVRVLLGRDTRESGEWVTAELARGLRMESAEVVDGGVLPTPAVACLTRDGDYMAGVVVSASHNPFQDNGVKVITATGEKADERLEARITARVADVSWQLPSGSMPTLVTTPGDAPYLGHVSRVFAGVSVPTGFSVAIDCANGATSHIGPLVYRQLGLRPVVLHGHPDGRNINLDCGSMHPERLAQVVVERGCRLGIAFDGDGDRVVFVDHRGAVVNGDAVLLIAARRLADAGRLPGRAVVATVMSNLGLEHALRADGITVP